MNNAQELINALERYSREDKSTNDRELIVTNEISTIDKGLLEKYNINFKTEGSSTKIYLDNQDVSIFKSYNDAIKHSNLENYSKINIALNIDISQQIFFENLYYFEKIKAILDNESIIDFKDRIKKDFFILSSTYGKISLSYAPNSEKIDFYKTKHFIDLGKLEELLKTESFPEFYKNSIAKFLSNNPDKSLYTILSNFDFLLSNALNSLSLYKHNFSFEEFENEFDKNLSNNIKKLQELTTSFQSKIMAIPLQFGVYIYLLSRFRENLTSTILVVVTIVIWSIFNYLITSKTYRNVNNLETKIKGEMTLIRQKSGIVEEKLSNLQTVLTKDIYTMKEIIYAYQTFSILFTLLILALASLL